MTPPPKMICNVKVTVAKNNVVASSPPSLTPYFLPSFHQELEIQARAHGLAVTSTSLCATDLMTRAIKQEPMLGDCTSDLYQHSATPDMSPPTTLDLNNGTISFDQMRTDDGEPGPYGAGSRNCKLKELVRDNTLSPISPSDPLLSSMSPESSNSVSNHHSSCSSMEEKEPGC